MNEAPATAEATMRALGEIMTVLLNSPQYRKASLAQIDALVKPALLTGQYILAKATPAGTDARIPIALAIWVSVSDETDQRLSASSERPLRLKPEDWKSGDNPWIVALAGDKRATSALIAQLREARFSNKIIKTIVTDGKGKAQIAEIKNAPPQQLAHH